MDIIYYIRDFLAQNNWTKVAILYEKTHRWEAIYESLMKSIKKDAMNISVELQDSFQKLDDLKHFENNKTVKDLDFMFGEFMRKLNKTARIVLLMSSVEYIREIMLCAAKRNLVNGDYVFIAVNPLAILGHPGEHHYYYWFHNLLGYQNTGDTDTEEEDRKNYPLLR
jgi:hypothetical protein